MFGIRVLIYLIGIAFVVWILFRLAGGRSIARPEKKQVDDMVRCARCGTFVPRDEAIHEGDKDYCSTGHRDEDR